VGAEAVEVPWVGDEVPGGRGSEEGCGGHTEEDLAEEVVVVERRGATTVAAADCLECGVSCSDK
jgi:hypothetical protein